MMMSNNITSQTNKNLLCIYIYLNIPITRVYINLCFLGGLPWNKGRGRD